MTGRAAAFAPLPADRAAYWAGFGHWDDVLFPNVVGLELEEVRVDYARMRLPYRPELRQPAGMVHGGAMATMVDTVVVPALASAFDRTPVMATVDLQIRFLNAARETDLVAEGWVVRRGRSISFCQAEVRRTVDDEVVAEAWMVYRVSAVGAGPA
ncbi:MAG: PaaI family thioesterase [Acidimicrobiales bacterium]